MSTACVFPVILFSVIVNLRRDVIFRYVGIIISLKPVPVLCLCLEFSSPYHLALRRNHNELHFRLWQLKLTPFTVNAVKICVVCSCRRSKKKNLTLSWHVGLFSGLDKMLLAWKFPVLQIMLSELNWHRHNHKSTLVG
jgi:hypothetical protein